LRKSLGVVGIVLCFAVTAVGLVAYKVWRKQGRLSASRNATAHLELARHTADRGWLLYKTGQFQQALAVLDSSTNLDPAFVDAWNYKGLTLKAMGREEDSRGAFEEALARCERGLRRLPNDATGWGTKGMILLNLGKYQEAVAAEDEAIRLNPMDPDCHAMKALVLANWGRRSDAEASARMALDMKPDHPIAAAVLQSVQKPTP